MGQQTGGWMGNGSQTWNASSPMYMHIDMPANEYPKGTLSMGNFGTGGSNCRWTCPNGTYGSTYWYQLYLCDGNGNNSYNIATIKIIGGQTNSGANSFSVNCPNLRGKSLHMKATCSNTTPYWYGRSTGISVGTATYAFNITVQQPAAGGTISCTTTSAVPGTSIEISNTPDRGYTFKKYTFSIDTVMLDDGHFYMPSGNVTVSAEFEKTLYYITPQANPAGAGIVSVNPGTANMGDTVAVSQQTAAGYYFNGYMFVPQVTLVNDEFTMPDSDVTVTGNYLQRSTASLDKTTMQGGDTVTMTISAEDAAYTHEYQLSFGTGMETNVISLSAGVSTESIIIPTNWSDAIPNQTSKGQGTLTVWTYSGGTEIGSYTITGLTYNVPESVVPVINTSQIKAERTIDGITYPAIDAYYVQNHCGIYIKVTASGSHGSTITSITASISGYSGNRYNYTSLTSPLIFTSGLLYIAGETTVTITITDSRGRTNVFTQKRTVQSYQAPTGMLHVWRCDSAGAEDDMGVYAKYSLSKQYTQLGSNAITWSISCSQGTATSPGDTGDLLPGNRKTFSQTSEYEITLTIADLLETFTMTVKLPSAKFAIYVQAGGDKLGIMKVPNLPIPTGKNSTFEIGADTQVYIGPDTLEEYIERNNERHFFQTSAVTQTVELESGCGYICTVNRRNTTDDGKQGLYLIQCGSDSCIRTIAASSVCTLSISGVNLSITTTDTYVAVSIMKVTW